MTQRGASEAVLTQIAAAQCRPCHLVSVHFDDEVVYMTDSYKAITYDGHEYTALGHFLGFTDIEENSDFMVASITGQLTGPDQTFISAFLSKSYIDRPVNIYKAFLDSDEVLIVDPVLIFSGRMDQPSINENPPTIENPEGTCTVSVKVSNHWVDFERKPGRHTNHEEQQIWFPGDKGFEFASQVTVGFTWGKA